MIKEEALFYDLQSRKICLPQNCPPALWYLHAVVAVRQNRAAKHLQHEKMHISMGNLTGRAPEGDPLTAPQQLGFHRDRHFVRPASATSCRLDCPCWSHTPITFQWLKIPPSSSLCGIPHFNARLHIQALPKMQLGRGCRCGKREWVCWVLVAATDTSAG